MNAWINLHALWQIVVLGLLAGAGLPALFAVGLRALSLPGSHAQPAAATVSSDQISGGSGQVFGGSPTGAAAAALCFAVVLAAIGYGIYLIVAST